MYEKEVCVCMCALVILGKRVDHNVFIMGKNIRSNILMLVM